MEQVVDKCEVVKVDSCRKVWPPGPHEEVHIGQIRQEPAADEEGAHGANGRNPALQRATGRLGMSLATCYTSLEQIKKSLNKKNQLSKK